MQDLQAGCSLDYEVVARRFYEEVLAPGVELPSGERHPDYRALLLRENICDWVDNQGLREVWLYGYHTDRIAPAESNMAGPYGDISNSYRFDDMPVCEHSYTLYNYSYARDLGEALENHGHQIEAIMDNLDLQLFRQRFVGPLGKSDATNGCGNVHIPPNAEVDYSWYETDAVATDCEDWTPERDGATTLVDCTTWGCESDGGAAFKIWWMSHIPGRGNGLSWQGRPMRNWWDAVGDFDAVKGQGSGLNAP